MGSQLFAFDINLQTAEPLFEPGIVLHDKYGRRFIYGRANGALTAGKTQQCTNDGTFDFTPMTTTTQDSKLWDLGVPNIDMTDNYYGWFWQGFGDFEMIVANAVSALSPLTTTGTAGVVGTGGTLIDGLINIDAGVTDTRVTCKAFGKLTVAVTAAFD